MIECKLSTIMGEKRLRVADVARGTDIHRNVITHYYRDDQALFSRDVLDKLCLFLDCQPGDLLEYVSDKRKGKG